MCALCICCSKPAVMPQNHVLNQRSKESSQVKLFTFSRWTCHWASKTLSAHITLHSEGQRSKRRNKRQNTFCWLEGDFKKVTWCRKHKLKMRDKVKIQRRSHWGTKMKLNTEGCSKVWGPIISYLILYVWTDGLHVGSPGVSALSSLVQLLLALLPPYILHCTSWLYLLIMTQSTQAHASMRDSSDSPQSLTQIHTDRLTAPTCQCWDRKRGGHMSVFDSYC